ncbi:MAG: arsenate reductase family protein [Thermodesulfobacteriota bacterium]
MESVKVYEYSKCGTCRKGLKFLDSHDIPYEKVPIVEKAPTKGELKRMLGFYDGDIRRLFNTSGGSYRELGMSGRIKTITAEEAIDLLAADGKLIKRPFILTDSFGLIGFKEDEWKRALKV